MTLACFSTTLVRRIGQLFVAILIVGCSNEPETGPGEIRWDHEICVRCVMAVSDPNYAAQIRYTPVSVESQNEVQPKNQASPQALGDLADAKPGLYKFDDLGCAVIWLEKQSWKDASGVEFWITDYESGEWIDARKAAYVKDRHTPMAYGLGAQPEHHSGTLNYEEAKLHVMAVEERFNQHAIPIYPVPTPKTPADLAVDKAVEKANQ